MSYPECSRQQKLENVKVSKKVVVALIKERTQNCIVALKPLSRME